MGQAEIEVAMSNIQLKLPVYKSMAVNDPLFEDTAYGMAEAVHEAEQYVVAAEKKAKKKAELQEIIGYYKKLDSFVRQIAETDKLRDDDSVEFIKEKKLKTATEYIDDMCTTSLPPDVMFA